MAVFPKSETSIANLAMQMITGISEHADLYPSITPEIAAALGGVYADYSGARAAQDQAQAAAKKATTAKRNKEAALEAQMRKIIHLAEVDCMDDPDNLEFIGWGERKSPTPLAKPGEVTALTPVYEGPGTLTLTWNKASSGGMVSSYRIERSDQPEGGGVPGPWMLITTSYEENATLPDQPRGIEMQYRVIATNATGDSLPSNIATVVL